MVRKTRERYRAEVDLSLRQSPDPASPLYEQWHEWPAGTVFDPPAHMDVARALARAIIEPVSDGGVSAISVSEEEVNDG